jgi:hypothetical protein
MSKYLCDLSMSCSSSGNVKNHAATFMCLYKEKQIQATAIESRHWCREHPFDSASLEAAAGLQKLHEAKDWAVDPAIARIEYLYQTILSGGEPELSATEAEIGGILFRCQRHILSETLSNHPGDSCPDHDLPRGLAQQCLHHLSKVSRKDFRGHVP